MLRDMMPIDTSRMGEALARPGMDTRTWFAAAIVEAVRVDATGKYADVAILPFGRPETVSIGAPGSSSHGLHVPYDVGSLVLVAFPDGNADAGGVILTALWDEGQPPPRAVSEHPDDPSWVAPPSRTLRLIASDDGSLVLEVDDGLVKLGTEGASLGVARQTDTVEVTIPIGTVAVANPTFPGSGSEFILNPLPITLTGSITSSSAKVKAT